MFLIPIVSPYNSTKNKIDFVMISIQLHIFSKIYFFNMQMSLQVFKSAQSLLQPKPKKTSGSILRNACITCETQLCVTTKKV